MNDREEILIRAGELITGDREKTHGSPAKNFDYAARLWSVILQRPIEPFQVALCLDALKTARIVSNPHHEDNWVDKAGYTALAWELVSNK